MRTWAIALVLAAGCKKPAPATPVTDDEDADEVEAERGPECTRLDEVVEEMCAEHPEHAACEGERPADEEGCKEAADALTAAPADLDDEPDEEEEW